MAFSYLELIASIFFILSSRAQPLNVTIDDTTPDPITGLSITYDPAEAWNDGVDCKKCTAHPGGNKAHNGTWHDSTFNVLPGSNSFPNQTLSASAEFNGSAVYIFCILARTTSAPTGNSDMSFYLDGDLVGTFVKPAPGTPGYDYDVPVYSNTSLLPGRHTIRIQNGHVKGPKSIVMLDRIVYTMDHPRSSSPTSPGIIIGTVIGSLAAIAIAVVLYYIYRRYKQRMERRQGGLKVHAFPQTVMPLVYRNSYLSNSTSHHFYSNHDQFFGPVSSPGEANYTQTHNSPGTLGYAYHYNVPIHSSNPNSRSSYMTSGNSMIKRQTPSRGVPSHSWPGSTLSHRQSQLPHPETNVATLPPIDVPPPAYFADMGEAGISRSDRHTVHDRKAFPSR